MSTIVIYAAVLPILFGTYGTVFVAEIVGDKLLYTTGILATRYRTPPIMVGMAVAFMAKMGVAVAVGTAISRLPKPLVAAITALSFLGIAYTLWRKPDERTEKKREEGSNTKAAMVSFAAIFFSEWADVGQVTAATMAARYGAPLLVWLGAVGAMVTKGILATFLGAGVRQWIRDRISPRAIRYGGVTLLLVLGVLAVVETLTGELG